MKKLSILFLIIVTYFVSNAQINCNPATITDVEHEGSGNRITWTMPTGGEEIMISQGSNYGNNGAGDKTSFGVYQRFTQEDLDSVNSGTLTQVIFIPTKYPSQTGFGHTFTIQIYKGGDWGTTDKRNPGTLIYSQELNNENLLANEENTVILEIPVIIDAFQELWIGYFCTNIDSIQTPSKMSAGVDIGPRKEGLGNILFYQNQWQTLYEITSAEYNWVIKGKVQTTEGKSVNIYFNDDILVSNISGTTHFHDNPIGEEHCYKVEVNCSDGNVSILSNEFCIEGNKIDEQKLKFDVYPNPANNELRITNHSHVSGKLSEANYELKITTVEIFDVYGRKQKAEWRMENKEIIINVSNLSLGIYFVRLIDGQGIFTQKFIKE